MSEAGYQMADPVRVRISRIVAENGRGPGPRRTALCNAAKAVLDGLTGSPWISTQELVEAVWPEALAKGEVISIRRRLFSDLTLLCDQGRLDGYWHTEEPKGLYGRMVYPKRWHKAVRAQAVRDALREAAGAVVKAWDLEAASEEVALAEAIAQLRSALLP